jgi:hypothetical protein
MIDRQFEPRVFLVGFHKDDGRIGVSKENCPFCHKDFEGVLAAAAEYEKNDLERELYHTDQEMQLQHEDKLRGRSLRRAVHEAISFHKASAEFTSFCGWPVESPDGFRVVTIIQVQKAVYESYYHLSQGTYMARERREFKRDRSFIEAVISGYLDETCMVIPKGDLGRAWGYIDDRNYLIQNAAKHFMRTVAIAGGNDFGLQGTFEACNTISTLKYEGTAGVGRIIFCRPDHSAIDKYVRFKEGIRLHDYGAIRKLLQMASGDLCLLCDSERVFGLGRIWDSYDPNGEDVFVVHFTKQFTWHVTHDGKTLMHVEYGKPSACVQQFPEERLRDDLKRIFAGIGEQKVGNLVNLMRCVSQQEHGCMLVISKVAESEAKRLDVQCTQVEPFVLTEKLVPLVTTIDGSVLIDPSGRCHAIGVILDGMASPQCRPDRGARYNSAVRYVSKHNPDSIAVVKSEDGSLSILPVLRPQIRRSDLNANLTRLRKAANQEKFDQKEVSQLRRWFGDNQFYLSAENCKEVNALVAQLSAQFPDEMTGSSESEFEANQEMNDSFFIEG